MGGQLEDYDNEHTAEATMSSNLLISARMAQSKSIQSEFELLSVSKNFIFEMY